MQPRGAEKSGIMHLTSKGRVEQSQRAKGECQTSEISVIVTVCIAHWFIYPHQNVPYIGPPGEYCLRINVQRKHSFEVCK